MEHGEVRRRVIPPGARPPAAVLVRNEAVLARVLSRRRVRRPRLEAHLCVWPAPAGGRRERGEDSSGSRLLRPAWDVWFISCSGFGSAGNLHAHAYTEFNVDGFVSL
ncbi:hypothetical protein SEVIR_6G127714v4 [Setaria viridis]